MNIHLQSIYSFSQLGGREAQQDARYPDTDRIDTAQRFFVVCDGVGGADHGERASQTVCQSMAHSLGPTDFSTVFTLEQFAQALDAAYDALDTLAQREQLNQTATTLTFAALHGGGALLAHIGDSRIYQVRRSQGIIYRSDDHSLVNQLVHSGVITPDEAIDHPQGNVITRCMAPVDEDGTRSRATVFTTADVQAGDRFLLCTDGVLHGLTDDQLAAMLAADTDAADIIARMAEQCRDSSDNNTAILITIDSVEGGEPQSDTVQEADTAQGSDTAQQTEGLVSVHEVESVRRQQRSSNPVTQFFKRLFQ